MKRKMLPLFIVMALVVMVLPFAGCQTKITSQTTAAPTSTGSVATQTTMAQPTTTSNLLGNMYLSGLPIVKDKVVFKFVAIQNSVVHKDLNELGIVKVWESETNIDFQFEAYAPADIAERVNLMIATQKLPDVFFGGAATNLIKNGADGTYLPLEALLAKWGPNMNALFAKRPDIISPCYAPDGHLYGFPQFYETGQHYCRGYYVHMDWLKETGVGMPKTTDDFLKLLRAFKGKDWNKDGSTAGDYPLGLCIKETANDIGSMFMWFGMPAYSINYVKSDKKIACGFTDQGYKAGVSFLRTIYSEGLCDPEIYTHDTQTYRAKVANYKYSVFGMFAPYNAFGNTKTQEEYRYQLLDPPTGPNGTKGWVWGPTKPMANAFVITKACKNPEIMVRFADYCADTKMSLQLAVGLLGQNLIDNKDGSYSQPAVIGEHEMFSSNSLHIITKDRWNLVKPGFFDAQRIPLNKLYETVVNLNTIFPMIQATPEESQKISTLSTDIMNYINQTQAKWVTEGGIENEWDAYVAKLKTMGLDNLLAIYQQQYDRYLAKAGK
jgi:putative aldouronate transport system substrate-binding protein